jgi:MFS family permease
MVTIIGPERTSRTGSVAGNQTFRRLLGASSVSMLGSHVTTIAYPLLVLRLTGSPFTAGCAVFAATAPSMFAYIPAGALVDRWSRRWGPRRVMLLSELGRGVAIGTVAAMLAFGKPMVPLLMAVAVIEGVLEVFSALAERSCVGSIVRGDQVSSALARTEARTHVVLVAGRPLGGLLFGFGAIFPFLADAASFIYSVLVLFGIKDDELAGKAVGTPRESPLKESLLTEIREGLQWIHEDKFARMTILSFSVGTLIFQALIMVFLGEAHSRQLSALAIGMVLAASGVGGALGSVAAKRLLPRVGYHWVLIQMSIWVIGFAFLILPAGRQFLFTAVIMAILGLTGALGNIALDSHLMQASQEMLARVTSVSRLASFAAFAIGPITGGVLVQEFGAQRAMFYLFFFTPVMLLLALFTPAAASRPASRAACSPQRRRARLGTIWPHRQPRRHRRPTGVRQRPTGRHAARQAVGEPVS